MASQSNIIAKAILIIDLDSTFLSFYSLPMNIKAGHKDRAHSHWLERELYDLATNPK